MFYGSYLRFILLLFVTLPSCLCSESNFENDAAFLQSECERVLPGCLCYDFEVVTGLSCTNLTDFDAFCERLSGGKLFPLNSTFELQIAGVQELPPGFLRNLIVFRIFVDDPYTEKIANEAFEGVLRLRRFHVRLSSIRDIPNFRPIQHSLRNINIDNSLLTSLTGTELQDLPLIETVSFVNNSIREVAPDAFQGTNGLIIFDISHNLLQTVPPHLFDPWIRIKKVVLSYNNLLHVDQLFAVAHPQFIYLDSNNLTNLDTILHPNMHQVETIQLSRNPLVRVTSTSFKGKVNGTRFLFLDWCGIQEFDAQHYEDFPILSTLDLSYNRIETITNQSISFGYKIELNFIGNKIKEFNVELPFNVRRVYLSDNNLTSLGRTLQFSQMSEVSMANNQIVTLGTEDFRGVHGVEVLDLQGNRIRTIERNTFQGIRKDLVYLDLSRNQISVLGGCVQYLSLLTALNLTDNRIQSFEEGEFTGLNELAELYLSDNRIVQLSGELQRLPQLQYLIISRNRIRNLRLSQIPPKLKYLYLRDNPFVCNCELYPFLELLNSTSGPSTDIPLCTPFDDSTELPSKCPEECECECTTNSKDEEYFIAVNCNSRSLQQLPLLFRAHNGSESLEYLNSTRVVLHPLRSGRGATLFSVQGPFQIEDEVGFLDLSNNSLSFPPEAPRFPLHLRHLLLKENHLAAPLHRPLAPLVSLKRISLSRNPWKCDCDTLEFKKWILSKSEIIVDMNETRCGSPQLEHAKLSGRVVSSLLDTDLCPSDIGLYVSLAFGILTFCLLVAALKITWTRYELNIKVYLYSKGVTWVKEKDIDRDKQFDGFLSFSHKDEQSVIRDLVKVIEEKAPNVRLCLHYKHFTAGEFIHDNIMAAVQNSKRTVLILSKNFLESEWCMMEFRAAHVQALKDRVHRIVVIKWGELPDDIDPALKLYLDSTTYLTWGEKYFWNNLFYILPTSTHSRETRQPNISPTPTCETMICQA